MKVWELIEQLSRMPAGAEVFARPSRGEASYTTQYLDLIDQSDPTSGAYLVLERDRA